MKDQLILFFISIIFVGCQSIQSKPDNNDLQIWKYGDLRLLDPVDALKPDQDLIALYTRINDRSFQIRLDFLDLETVSENDIYILMDTNPGGLAQIEVNKNETVPVDLNWDYLIKIPGKGKIAIVNDQLMPIYGMELIITRNVTQDTIIISFNKSILPISLGTTTIQVIITPTKQLNVVDKSSPFAIDGPSPTRAKVIFAFWNTFSSTTPAQTLRSWAGAHAGPMSSRHGLKYLLDTAAKTKSTVFLLDLLTPDTLSALDYINALPRIRKLMAQGILALPDEINNYQSIVFGGDTKAGLINYIANGMDIRKIWNINTNMKGISTGISNDVILLYSRNIMINYIYKLGNYDYAHNADNKSVCLLLPSDYSLLNIESGLSLECKHLLLAFAIMNPTTPLLFGGDFSNSILGDPVVSSDVFTYIYEHPWIQILSIYDLNTPNIFKFATPLPASASQSEKGDVLPLTNSIEGASSSSKETKVLEYLLKSPKNQLSKLAWQVFNYLTQPASKDILTLRSNYIGQVGQILAAAEWAAKPSVIETCDLDLDYDSINECILANNHIFTIIEPEGGYIAFMFSVDISGVHQIIGPTWEFTVGLSDPSTWEPSLGLRSDPSQVLGAFSDNFSNWYSYDLELLNHSIIMKGDRMTMRKSAAILPDGLHIDLYNFPQTPYATYIPVVLDPWLRYTSGWGDLYSGVSTKYMLQWGINSGESVLIRSTNQIIGYQFNATRTALAYPEDPNFDYSLGHYLPYPMALTEIKSSDITSVDITINR